MFTTASAKNRVVTNALSVTYSVERRYETISGVKTYWYKVTRFAAKTYSYLDLTPAAAAEVMAAKVAKYTRTTRKCISRTLDKTSESLTTDISTSRNGSGSYNVDINVSESDSTHSASIPADPATLFTTENARDYDEGESGITVDSTTHDGSTLTITISVTGELVGTLCSNVGLYYDGSRVTTGVTIYQSGEKAYKIVATNWESSHNTGTVRIGDSEADWQYTAPSVTLTSTTGAIEWEPPTSILYIDLTAALAGSIETETSSVQFWAQEYYSLTGEWSDWYELTTGMTIVVTGNEVNGTSSQQIYSLHGSYNFKATCGDVTSNIIHYEWSF